MDEDIFGLIVVFSLLLSIVITVCISITINHSKDIEYEKYKMNVYGESINKIEE